MSFVQGWNNDTEVRRTVELLERAARGDGGEAVIVQALEADDVAIRDHAISLAVRHLEPEDLGRLVADDENATLRNAALEALERQGPYAVPYLREMAVDTNPEVAMFAVQALTRVPDPGTIPTLVRLLEHDDENVSLAAIEALGSHGAEDAVPRLREMMSGGFWQQFAVIRSLGEIGDPRGVPSILEALNDEMLVEPAVEALGGIATAACLGPLAEVIENNAQEPVRKKALCAIENVLDRNPAADVRFQEPGQDSDLGAFLAAALDSTDSSLARAAASLAITAGLSSLFARVARRAVDSEDRAWVSDLFRRHPEPFRRNLASLLSDEDPRVRRGVLEAGPADKKLVPLILQRVRDESAEVRAAACRALGRCRSASAVPMLLGRLPLAVGDERDALIEGLSRMPVESLVSLAPFLAAGQPEPVAMAALAVVEATECAALAADVAELLATDRPEVRLAALRAAGVLGNLEADRYLVPLLDDPDPGIRVEAIEVLARRGHEGLAPRLAPMLEMDDLVRYHAIRALGRLRAGEAAGPLRHLFSRAHTHEQIEIVSALIRIAPSWIVEFLEEQYEGNNPEIRRIAAEGLVRLPGALTTSDLVSMSGDEDWSIRSFAAWGLGRTAGSQEGREALLALCRDTEPLVARIAREALERNA